MSKGLILAVLAVAAFSLTLPITKLILVDFDPLFVSAGRAALAAFIAAFLLLVFRVPIPRFDHLKMLFVIALGIVIGFPMLSTIAMQAVPASHGGVVLGILPLMTSLMAIFINNEKPSPKFWIAACIGGLIVIAYSLQDGWSGFHLGDVALLGSVLAAAIGYALGAKLTRAMPAWQVICWALLVSFPFTLLVTLYYFPSNIAATAASSWLGFLYLALVSQLFAFFLWYHALHLSGTAKASQIQLLQPFFTLIAATWLLNESISLLSILTALLVIITVMIGWRSRVTNTAQIKVKE